MACLRPDHQKIAAAAQSVATVVAQGPAGWLVDWSEHKKRLIIAAAAAVAVGALEWFGRLIGPPKS